MKLEIQQPNKSLNKAYLREKVSRNDIETFKTNLKTLLSKIDSAESEEHHKYPVADFLKDTWYKDQYEINTKGRTDFVIHNGKTTKDSAGVIIEVKSPSNQSEMISEAKPNKKAMHELILYYLRERIEANQTEIKHLIITNIWEWYIFDEKWFEENIYRSRLKKEYETYKHSGKDTKFFFDSIAKPFLDELTEPIPCTFFDFRTYEATIRNDNKKEDNKLIALYKLLSPAHLLKQPFANDSNSLDTKFYAELLYIIGLEEVKDGSKKLIQRKEKPDAASLLESVIMKLEDKDSLRNIAAPSTYGNTRKDQLFNVALELCITWINRILFIKLLEGQLVTYHKGDKDYLFLNTKVVFDYDELNNLFFQVLAEKNGNRHEHLKDKFSKIPYLNSSLFDRTALERQAIEIGALDNRLELPVSGGTVLKSDHGKRRTGKLHTLQYLFDFLDAYDFSSDGGEEIQEENKNLINASVLGLIFEKINGYKDGSFFTPGFVTMYMCRETIRRAVLQKFNEARGWTCETIGQLYDKVGDKKKEANTIINSLKICDPAVGSGHFLVSALNELIAIKSELKILLDRKGITLRDYHVEVVNDALIVTDEDGKLLDYKPKSPESQRIQEALFHEKETIIENCLFGVDINPNSVKICRLRLWIELLKNAYYTSASNFTELETLPNIDINIKCGNSLISRFALDEDISAALKSIKWDIEAYRGFVKDYKNATNKEEKQGLEKIINQIKGDFITHIGRDSKDQKKLDALNAELYTKYYANKLFSQELNSIQLNDKKKIESNIVQQKKKIDDVKNNVIFKNAFEWRFEFPEVLSDEGKYVGFDVIIGNPPYIFGGNEGISNLEKFFYAQNYQSGKGKINLFTLFIEKAFDLMKLDSNFSFIIPNTFLRVTSYSESRKLLVENYTINTIYDFGDKVFDDAITTSIVIVAQKKISSLEHEIKVISGTDYNTIMQYKLKDFNYVIAINIDDDDQKLLKKLSNNSFPLGSICKEMIFGVVITKNKNEVVDSHRHDGWQPFLEGKDIGPYFINPIHSYLNYDSKLLHRSRTKEVFEVPEKLMIQRITGGLTPLKVAYDNRQLYNKESINNIILKENSNYDCKFILSILNSKLINWFYTKQFTNESKLTVNLSKEYLSQIPIAITLPSDQEAFIKLANEILLTKEANSKADTSALQQQIDQLVYQQYGLTEEEIKIVEAS